MAANATSRGYIKVSQGSRTFWLTSMPARDLVRVSYIARRGETSEQGAVQRLLSPRRIASIKDFAIHVGVFPGTIILNWVSETYPLRRTSKSLTIPRRKQSAQIIDGQHRVAGLEEAIDEESRIANLEIPVAIYENLTTTECADIFLSINTEQKPVPRSLVFDLYGEASGFIVDHAAVRAKDIAQQLNEDSKSAYYGFVKFPGSPPRERGIPLSTVVSALKPLVEDKGYFEQVGLVELHMQSQFLINFFSVLKRSYGERWEGKDNAFRYSAGFSGAIEFVKSKLLGYCNILGDFTENAIAEAFCLKEDQLILQSDTKGLQGRKAFSYVAQLLEVGFVPKTPKQKIKV